MRLLNGKKLLIWKENLSVTVVRKSLFQSLAFGQPYQFLFVIQKLALEHFEWLQFQIFSDNSMNWCMMNVKLWRELSKWIIGVPFDLSFNSSLIFLWSCRSLSSSSRSVFVAVCFQKPLNCIGNSLLRNSEAFADFLLEKFPSGMSLRQVLELTFLSSLCSWRLFPCSIKASLEVIQGQ